MRPFLPPSCRLYPDLIFHTTLRSLNCFLSVPHTKHSEMHCPASPCLVFQLLLLSLCFTSAWLLNLNPFGQGGQISEQTKFPILSCNVLWDQRANSMEIPLPRYFSATNSRALHQGSNPTSPFQYFHLTPTETVLPPLSSKPSFIDAFFFFWGGENS